MLSMSTLTVIDDRRMTIVCVVIVRNGVFRFRKTVVMCSVMFFFFQAEDGIRDYKVTGVQTCALPIFTGVARNESRAGRGADFGLHPCAVGADLHAAPGLVGCRRDQGGAPGRRRPDAGAVARHPGCGLAVLHDAEP